MDCGVPFLHVGMPVNNIIPDWNDLVYRQDWKTAIEDAAFHQQFPEFTGRICPAPCEGRACCASTRTRSASSRSTCNRNRAWEEGWVASATGAHKPGKKVAVVGSGPAVARLPQQLARAGHDVTCSRRATASAGWLRTAFPTSSSKRRDDRRLDQMRAEGVKFPRGRFRRRTPARPGRRQ